MVRHHRKRALAYFYVPVFFAVLGYILLYVALKPVITFATDVSALIISESVPDFNSELLSIYDPNAAESVVVADDDDPESENPTVSLSTIELPVYGTHYANLSCDRIGLDAPVYWGDSTQILRSGAGQSISSFLPGFGRIILLSAHNTTYFKPLQEIAVGDVVTYQTNYGVYEYEITQVEVVAAQTLRDNIDEILSVDEEELIMYTCYPFYAIAGTKTDRLVAVGTRISGPDIVD